MSFRFVRGNGTTSDPAAFSFPASGVIKANQPVDWLRNGTGGAVVGPTASSSTATMVFGIAQGYVQGASDTYVNVIPLGDDQLWEADCANIATTAQLGVRHALSASDRSVVHNTASDVVNQTGIFLALAMTSLATGSGKLIGKFVRTDNVVAQSPTTWI